MALIDWSDSLSVNISLIDDQHKKLIGLINDLHDAMKQGKAKDVLTKIVASLADYTNTHFGAEERYFDEFGYDKKESHVAQHKIFIDKIAEFNDKLEKGNIGLSIDISIFLGEWFRKHIKGTDILYSNVFKEHGVK